MSSKKSRYKGKVEESKKKSSALKVNDGIDQPPQVNPRLKFKRKERKFDADYYAKGILDGDYNILGQAITLIESTRADQKELAGEIINKCIPYSGKSIRIGITGVPGAGKSTFIETLGSNLLKTGKKLAVLAIDPSSERSKGSILGDKTRMNTLSQEKDAFIRPSPSAGSLGGVARKTRESIILCEAAGFDTIFVETVGVGQSEIAVHSMVDFFLLIMIAGAGDELQGIKRGIMEMADVIAINKADGNNKERAELARAQFQNALHLFPKSESGFDPKVITCSALKNSGVDDVWSTLGNYIEITKENGFFHDRRSRQARYWMYETINESLKQDFYNNEAIKQERGRLEESVTAGKMSSFEAAKKLMEMYYKKR